MTPESIARVRASFSEVAREPRALAARFYEELFLMAPELRSLFPSDLTSLQGHFEAALALVIRNLEEMKALQDPLRDLGVQHVHWRARPEDYLFVRDAILRAVRKSSASWDATLEEDWCRAISAIAVPMLQGAAVHTAMMAERLAAED